jgi:hypothetical protein
MLRSANAAVVAAVTGDLNNVLAGGILAMLAAILRIVVHRTPAGTVCTLVIF